jgi:Mn2+/Fe2+ NRAMP family transporter
MHPPVHRLRRRRRHATRALAVLAVLGPGLPAGLSDDDPAGITTYSVLGAEHGYELLWVLGVSVAALVVTALMFAGSFHRVEHVLLALSAVFVTYVGACILARPDWGAAARCCCPRCCC